MLNQCKWIVLALLVLLSGCGGADSSSTQCRGGGLNSQCESPAVSLAFQQVSNNLPLSVDAGVHSAFSLAANANLLYASVTVCAPGSTTECTTIDHVQVDTGSVGLRVLASKVSSLNLPSLMPSGTDPQWECYPFVIGSLWGRNVVADIGLGPLVASNVPMQLIQDDAAAPLQAPQNCIDNAQGLVLSDAVALGSNGILGIGSVNLDCGSTCVTGDYGAPPNLVQYYTCPSGATGSIQCVAAAVPPNFQAYNPVAALPDGPAGQSYSNGIVISMPAVTGLGAVSASGELIFGINSESNNQLGALQPVYLGTDVLANNGASYLSITTTYQGQNIYSSYLDTGSNALFFNDSTIKQCAGTGSMNWYCPTATVTNSAQISDGLSASAAAPISVMFSVASAENLFNTNNTAFGNLAGTAPVAGPSSFAWGLPFYLGRSVYQSIWNLTSPSGPWYAWKSI